MRDIATYAKTLIGQASASVLGVIAVLIMGTNVAHPVPANPGTMQVTQPDGSSFRAVMRGDEHFGWMETLDGYTVLKNKRTGFFEYATESPEGDLALSGIVVTPNHSLDSVPSEQRPKKGLRPKEAVTR